MSGLYAYIDDNYIQQVANTKGWCDLGDWSTEREDDYPVMAALYEHGVATKFRVLKRELTAAKSVCRNREIKEVISALLEALARVKGHPQVLAILDEDAAAEDDPDDEND